MGAAQPFHRSRGSCTVNGSAHVSQPANRNTSYLTPFDHGAEDYCGYHARLATDESASWLEYLCLIGTRLKT